MSDLPQKVINQINKAGLPTTGTHPFRPRLVQNRHGDLMIEKKAVSKGPKKDKKGFVDDQGRIWIRDRGHAGLPDHWDVQINDGDEYVRVGMNGEELS